VPSLPIRPRSTAWFSHVGANPQQGRNTGSYARIQSGDAITPSAVWWHAVRKLVRHVRSWWKTHPSPRREEKQGNHLPLASQSHAAWVRRYMRGGP